NRFRSRVACDEADVKGLIRYVHRNPLRAGMTSSLDGLARDPWNGHGALMGVQRPRPFHSAQAALAYFGDAARDARIALRSWMLAAQAADELALSPYERFERGRRRACDERGVAIAALEAGARDLATTRIRRSLAAIALRQLGLPARAVARALGASP